MMKLLRDTWLVFQRQIVQTVRTPVWIVMGVIQPVNYLLLFAPLLRQALDTPGDAQAYGLFVPGILVMLTVFVTSFAGFGLLAELRAGVIERCRVTPVSRLALLLGRSLRDVASVLVQCTIVVTLSLLFGLSAHLGGIIVSYAVLSIMAVTVSAFSYGLALRLHSEEGLSSVVNFLSQPLVLLSGILLPMTFGPAWLRTVSGLDPLTWAVDASRASFSGDLADADVWRAFGLLTVLMVAALAWSARAFTRSVR
jgi:ABC-2 type transport system permease protein